MRQLPSSVKIGPIEYEIEAVPDLVHERDGEKVYLNGHIMLDEEKILIDAGLSYRQAVVTLWHEIFHAILGQAGSEAAFDESIVRPLGYGLLDVALHNPRLLETLRERKQVDTGMDIDIEFTGTYEDLVAALSAMLPEQEGPDFEFETESAPGTDVPRADLTGVQEVEIEPVEEGSDDWRLPMDAWTTDTVCGAREGDPDPGQPEGELYSRNCPGCGGEPCGMIDWKAEDDTGAELDADAYIGVCNCFACRGYRSR